MPIAYSYLRMSRTEQLQGDSLRRQTALAREYAEANGLTLDEGMQDIGVSAFRGQNQSEGTLSGFLTLLSAGKIAAGSFLLVENLDRLSRQEVNQAFMLFNSIINAGVVIVTLSDGQVYSQETIRADWSKLMVSIVYMARAHDESMMRSRRIGAAWKDLRVKARSEGGPKITARIPTWLELAADRKTFRVREAEADVVRRIFDECVSGIGAMVTAQRLSEEGIPTFRGAFGWHPSAVKKILHSEAVIGKFQPHSLQGKKRVPEGEPIAGYFPQIISDQVFWAAQASMASRRQSSGGRKGEQLSNLLSGLVFCAACDGPMHFINKGPKPKGGTYLQCDTARRHAGCICTEVYRYDFVETAIASTMSKRTFEALFLMENDAIQNMQDELAAIEARLEVENKRLDRWMAVVGNDLVPFDDGLTKQIRQCREGIHSLQAQRKRLRESVRSAEAVGKQQAVDDLDRVQSMLDAANAIRDPAEKFKQRSRIALGLWRAISFIVFHLDTASIHYADGEVAQADLALQKKDRKAYELGIEQMHYAAPLRDARMKARAVAASQN